MAGEAGADPSGSEQGLPGTSPVRAVLFATPRWARDGGVGAHVEASAEQLAMRGIRVMILAARVESELQIPGVTLHPRPDLFNTALGIDERLGEPLAEQADVVHVHQVDDADVVRGLRRHAPVLVSAHAYTACASGLHYFRPGHECGRGHGPGCIANMLLRGCAHLRNPARLPTKYSDAAQGLAALAQADLAVSYSTAVDRHLAANGIERRVIVPYFPTMRPRPGSGHEGRRRVVFAGRVVPSKGVGVLIRAARAVDGEFVVCGDGRQLPAMRSLAARLGVQEKVRFTGWLGGQELAGELADASIVVMPSVWPEPFGLVGIEGHSAGRPAVASAAGGIEDWLEHGVNGLAVAPGDPDALAAALGELLADPARQSEMGAAGRARVADRFSPERHVSLLLEGYARAARTWRAQR